MARHLFLSGYLLTREDWEWLDDDGRAVLTKMLAEEGRTPRFDDGSKKRGDSKLS
jgi:hypothetical protein